MTVCVVFVQEDFSIAFKMSGMSDTPYRALLLEKDTKIALDSFTRIQAASEGCSLGRLALNTSTACDGLSSAVSATINRVTLQASKDVQEQAKRLCASRDKRFGWPCEEFDAAKAMLEGIDRQLCVGNVDCINCDAIDASLRTAGQLVEEAITLPSHSALLAVTGGVCTSEMSHLQLDVDVGTSAVSHADRMKRGQGNIVTLSCRDAFGAPVRTVRAEDVTVGLTALATGWSVDVEGVEEGVVAVRVTPGDEGELTVTLVVDVVNTRIQAPLQVRDVFALII